MTTRALTPKRSVTGWKATIAVAMSNYIEAGAIIAIATSSTAWQNEFGFGDGALGLLAALSANAFGAAIGAAIGGPLCDRYGRKFIYTYDLLLFLLGSLAVTFSFNFGSLLVGVIMMGIAVGAGVPASWTYIAEEAPHEQRAKHVGTAQLAWSVGPMIGFLLAIIVEPLGLFGNRLIFLHLGIIAAITWWVRRGLPESRRWKEQRETELASGARVNFFSGVVSLLKNPKNLLPLLFLFGVYALWNMVAGQSGIFQPRVYAAAGLEDATSQNWLQVLLWGCTVVATYFGFMLLADKVSRRWLYCFGALLGVVAAWIVLIYAKPGMTSMLIFAIGWGISSGIGAQAFYGLWASELFATKYRASAQGVLFFAARVMVGLLSSVFPVLLGTIGLIKLGYLIVGLLVLAMLIGTIFAPKTQGKTLEEIETERYGEKASA
jgi:inositol transporter-like SP family MFS transporter